MSGPTSTDGGKRHLPAFRPIRAALADDPDFQKLSPLAKLLWYTLRLKLGPYAIGMFYEETLPRMVNANVADVNGALGELAKPYGGRELGWLIRSDTVFWLVDGLQHEVWITNDNHWLGVRRYVAQLPDCPVVRQYLSFLQERINAQPEPPADSHLSAGLRER